MLKYRHFQLENVPVTVHDLRQLTTAPSRAMRMRMESIT
jgi:hypothetical protein